MEINTLNDEAAQRLRCDASPWFTAWVEGRP